MVAGSSGSFVLGYFDPLALMQRVADQALGLVRGAEGSLVGLLGDGYITYVCGSGYLSGSLGVRTAVESSIGGLSAMSGQVLRCDDTEADPRVDREVCRRLGTRSAVCVPLSRGAQVSGVLAVGSRRPFMFDDGDVSVLEDMAELISVTVGVAEDWSRVKAVLDRIAEPGGQGRSGRVSSASAGRFVMKVIDPQAAALAEGRRRTEEVLADPSGVSLVFQPVVELASGTVVAVEALARFDRPPKRPPDLWFSEAHRVGLGAELEMLAVTRALGCLEALPGGVAMNINAGPQTVLRPQLSEALSRTGEARRVVVEVTEHAAVEDYPKLVQATTRLRQMGARLAVDDTGSGFASLAHILKLAPDFIKLDRELVSGIDLDPVRRALATALVSFASETGAQIVAEGIENQDELDVVRCLGVSYAQGFHLGRPDSLGALFPKPALRNAG
jgi:EAL domain-containing protein (putative c-di-GMP-specific phosphodiesterase class I)